MEKTDVKSEVIQLLRDGKALTLKEVSEMVGLSRWDIGELAAFDLAFEADLQAALADARQAVVDLCERQLAEKAAAGDNAVLMFIAKTQGRERGYGDKVEIDHKQSVKLDLDEAARRIAFAMQAAIASGKTINGHFSEVVPLEVGNQNKERARIARKAKLNGLIDDPKAKRQK
jgi:hypothetical protein